MKRLTAAMALVFCPVLAVADETCMAGWESIVTFAGPLGEEISEAQITSADDGWCAVSATLDIDTIEAKFRFDRLTQAPQNARSIEVTLKNVDARIGVFDVTAALSYQAETGVLRLHTLSARADDGRGLRASADISLDASKDGSDFQAALSALALQDLSLAVFVTPGLLQETGIDLSDLSRVTVDNALRDVSDRQVNRRSRSEFLRFVGAMPNVRGTLDIALNAPVGLRAPQIVDTFVRLDQADDDVAITAALGAALTDATLDLAWKPGRM